MTHDRETGIQAIIFLQAMLGITEPREKAEKGWDRMADWEKESTMRAYAMFKK